MRAYLDYNAGAPMRKVAKEAMVEVIQKCGNPSSVHKEGREQRAVIEDARKQVAELVGAKPQNVIFTSGATEAANLALTKNIKVGGNSKDVGKLLVSEVEHHAVISGGRFNRTDVEMIPVNQDGVIDVGRTQKIIQKFEAPLVAIQKVNSETGVIQPVEEVVEDVRAKGGLILSDAVQAAGKIRLDIEKMGVDFLVLAAHKIGGPQGVGALVTKDENVDVEPAIKGGGQEKNRRAGTENVAAIAGFGAAAGEAKKEADKPDPKIKNMRDEIVRCIKQAKGSVVFGEGAERVDNTVMFAFEEVDAQTAIIKFDLDGIAVSSGSACSSGKVEKSHVLKAMKIPDNIVKNAIRVSIGWDTSQEHINMFIKTFGEITKGRNANQTTEQAA